jgi:transposase-like protein
MRRYSEAIKADVKRRISPPNPQRMARITKETGIHVATLYLWRKGWRLEGEVVPASQKAPTTRKVVTPLNRKPGGLMEQSNASLQRGDQG